MKTNFRRNSFQRFSRIPGAMLLLVGAFVLLFIYRENARALFSTVGVTVSSPFWVAGEFVAHTWSNTRAYFTDREDLVREMVALRQSRDELALRVRSHEALALQYETLLNSLGRTQKKQTILAAVVDIPGRTLYDTLRIDVGEVDGLSGGELVWAGEIPVGTVATVLRTSATVELFSLSGRETRSVLVESVARIPIILMGVGGGDFIFTLPAEFSVTPGTPVLLPGIVPALLAEVFSIDKTEHDALQTIHARVPFNPYTLSFVQIDLPKLLK